MNNSKKEAKKEQKQIRSFQKKSIDMPELLPFVQYKNNCFIMRNGKYIDILKLICNDVLSLSQDNQDTINYTYEKFYRTYAGDIKIIGINMPVDTTPNQKYIKHKLDTADNPIQKIFLEEELAQEEVAAEILTQREYYIMFFFESLKEHDKAVEDCCYTLGSHFLIDKISQSEKEAVLFQLCNKNVPLDINKISDIRLPKQSAIDRYVSEQGFDPYLIARIQPQGGITFKDDKYISTGTGYEACVHLYDYKLYISDYWLNRILNIKDVISTVDISTENTEEVKKNLNKAMEEQDDRINNADTNKAYIEAKNRLDELARLFNEIDSFEEIVKLVHIRLFVAGKTKEELENKIAEVSASLNSNGFKGTVFLGETKAEWYSAFQSYSEQSKSEYSRYGQAIPSHELAFGNPFIFSSLNDPYGGYMGTTVNSGGIFNFDLFAITPYRTQYNGLITGNMGAGKSTTLKNIITILYSFGVIIRGFDVKDEYSELIKVLGGKMIYLDGRDGIINILDILETAETDFGSYTRHIGKLKIIYKFFKRTADENEISVFSNMLDILYRNFNLRGDDGRKITGLDPKCYPTMSDLLKVINNELNKPTDESFDKVQVGLDLERRKILLRVQTTISDMVANFGQIFDGHTSIKNIFNEQVVFFNITSLKDSYPAVFAAVLYNAIQLCWDNCVKTQMPMKNLYTENKINWADITRYMIFIDECHRVLNAQNDFAVEPIINFMKEGRHMFAGIWLATQQTSEFSYEGATENGIVQMKALLDLCQYKLIMKQDSSTINTLNQIFKGQMTEYEISQIPTFEKGQGILSIAGDKNVIVNIDVSDERLAMFKGGA